MNSNNKIHNIMIKMINNGNNIIYRIMIINM